MSLIHWNFIDTLMMCWYTKTFSTLLNIKEARIFKNKGIKGCHISKFISKLKQLLILLKIINLLWKWNVSNTLSVPYTYFHT
jgi:hypothetical protein